MRANAQEYIEDSEYVICPWTLIGPGQVYTHNLQEKDQGEGVTQRFYPLQIAKAGGIE